MTSKTEVHWSSLAVVVGLILTTGFSAEAGAQERDKRSADRSIGRAVAGTYLLDVRHEGFPPAAALVTLTRGGGFIATDTSDKGAGGLSTIDSPVHGIWKPAGGQTLTATTLYFGFDKEGIPQWISRTTGTFTFNERFTQGRGKLKVEQFKIDQDPLDPRQKPVTTLLGEFTARRMTAD